MTARPSTMSDSRPTRQTHAATPRRRSTASTPRTTARSRPRCACCQVRRKTTCARSMGCCARSTISSTTTTPRRQSAWNRWSAGRAAGRPTPPRRTPSQTLEPAPPAPRAAVRILSRDAPRHRAPADRRRRGPRPLLPAGRRVCRDRARGHSRRRRPGGRPREGRHGRARARDAGDEHPARHRRGPRRPAASTSPQAAIERFGFPTPGAREELLRDQIARADALYEEGLPAIALLARGREAMALSAALYREILREIERQGFGREPGRVVVPLERRQMLADRNQADRDQLHKA